MRKLFYILSIVVFTSSSCFAEGFDAIAPANPLSPVSIPANIVAIPVKKAVLTHNNLYNQYAIAFDRFMQSNVKSAYSDFRVLIETMDESDFGYIQLAEKMADIGFFNLSDLAISKSDDKSLSDYIVEDMKLYYFPSKKLKKDDEIYLGEVFSNIMYNDQSKEATAELVKNISLLENSDYANYIASLGYLKSNDLINAENYINKAIGMNAQNLNYKKLKAEILSQGKKPQNALKILDYIKSQKLYSTDFTRKVNSLEQFVLYKSKKNYSEKMYHLGYYYYYENELAKSVRTLQNAFSTKKKLNQDVFALLSSVYFNMNDFEKAQDNAQKALKINADNLSALLVLGDLSYRTRDYKNALKYYKKAENNDKYSFESSVKIAQTYEQLGKSKKAFEIYERLLKIYDNCYIAYYKIALADKSKEIAYLKKAIAINVKFKDAWIDLGRCSIEQQNFKDAKKYLTIANYIDENDFRYYYYQGILVKRQGQDGSYYFKKSLSLNPDYEPVKKELEI